jgi:hypothetical protein
MEQSRPVRNKSYGIIRDLLDNADGQGGMQSNVIYVAATPEMFQTEKGFPEYEALRSRLANAAAFITPKLIDWRGVIVDLTKTPLPHDMLVQLADRIIDIHATARNWKPRQYLTPDITKQVVDAVEAQGAAVSKPRLLASCAASLLEIVEQNRDEPIAAIVISTLNAAKQALLKKPVIEKWEDG